MRPRIVTFVNADYIPVAQNWLRMLEVIGLDETVVLVSLDQETRDAFPANQVLHRPLPVKGYELDALWEHRIEVMHAMLSEGVAIIHSDVDAIWLRDPLPDIEACRTPAVFSQGTVWPADVHSMYGFVLCCGFFYLDARHETLAFLDAVASRIKFDRDDQIAVNRTVTTLIDSWAIEAPYEVAFKDTHFVASRSAIRSRMTTDGPETFSVSVLPHHAYPRIVDVVTAETVVAHPLSGKTPSEKKKCLTDLGLWLS